MQVYSRSSRNRRWMAELLALFGENRMKLSRSDMERVELFDIYAGDNIPPGTKSLAFHVHFQAHDRTLTTEEVNRSLQGLMRTLEREVQASLRS